MSMETKQRAWEGRLAAVLSLTLGQWAAENVVQIIEGIPHLKGFACPLQPHSSTYSKNAAEK
jgi:hypothetical protein